MGVIINEFEIVADSPAAAAPETAAPTAEAQEAVTQTRLSPHNVEQLLRHETNRWLRLFAH